MDEATKLISTSKVDLLKFGVALHIYSPKVEMFGQIASQIDGIPECPVVVDIGNTFICDTSRIEATIGKVCVISKQHKFI